MTLDKILEEIKKADRIVILTHEEPDGDAIGSSLAVAFALQKFGKDADVIKPDIPPMFNFMPGIETLKKESDVKNYDLAIAVDASDGKILEGYTPYFENAKVKIVVDHHGSNKMYGDINFVDPVAPACCQILIEMFEYFKVELTKEIAICIMTGIITDTGGFKHNATAETFEFTAEMLRLGVNISEIYRKTLCTKTKASFELGRIATDRLELLENGKIAFTYITLEDEKKLNATRGDHEGIVEIGKQIENVEVSIFLHESENKGFKISLRSIEYVNVADVALMFGGGGHIKAAGAYAVGGVEQIKERLVNEIKKQLK